MTTSLVCIDCQVDFCDPTSGTLVVPGAMGDMARLSTLIIKSWNKINKIFVTRDSHPRIHIAHPNFWRDSNGNMPNVFRQITAKQVRDGEWTLAIPVLKQRVLTYLDALEVGNKFDLTIWPIHCETGSVGGTIIPVLQEALDYWQDQRTQNVYDIPKGSNPFTEHYSAIKAEVVDPNDPSTDFNVEFLNALNKSDTILWAGEASSHCVYATLMDSINYFGVQSDFVKKLVVLTDAMSSVTGYEAQTKKRMEELQSLGVRMSTTLEWMGNHD